MTHNLALRRFSDGGKSTLGLLFLDLVWNCYTLEDTFRNVKIPGQTRIPEGTYEIKLNTVVGMNETYKIRYPAMHVGMLEITNVPNYTYVLIHQGNTDEDTAGCVLLGMTANNNKDNKGLIGDSDKAYQKVYAQIAEWLKEGDRVFLTIDDIEPIILK